MRKDARIDVEQRDEDSPGDEENRKGGEEGACGGEGSQLQHLDGNENGRCEVKKSILCVQSSDNHS